MLGSSTRHVSAMATSTVRSDEAGARFYFDRSGLGRCQFLSPLAGSISFSSGSSSLAGCQISHRGTWKDRMLRLTDTDRGDSGLSPSYGIRHRSYDGSVFRLRGPSRLFIAPTMYIPTAIITTPRKATHHKSAKQASGIASANKTSRCMSCPLPSDQTTTGHDQTFRNSKQFSLAERSSTPPQTWTRQHAGLTLRHRREKAGPHSR
jgi:hypothetical protein